MYKLQIAEKLQVAVVTTKGSAELLQSGSKEKNQHTSNRSCHIYGTGGVRMSKAVQLDNFITCWASIVLEDLHSTWGSCAIGCLGHSWDLLSCCLVKKMGWCFVVKRQTV